MVTLITLLVMNQTGIIKLQIVLVPMVYVRLCQVVKWRVLALIGSLIRLRNSSGALGMLSAVMVVGARRTITGSPTTTGKQLCTALADFGQSPNSASAFGALRRYQLQCSRTVFKYGLLRASLAPPHCIQMQKLLAPSTYVQKTTTKNLIIRYEKAPQGSMPGEALGGQLKLHYSPVASPPIICEGRTYQAQPILSSSDRLTRPASTSAASGSSSETGASWRATARMTSAENSSP
jgi:hypothetical protein